MRFPAVPGHVEGEMWLALLEAKALAVLAQAEAEEADRRASRARRNATQARERYLNIWREAGGQLKLDLDLPTGTEKQ